MLPILTGTIKLNNQTRVTPCVQSTTGVTLVVGGHNGAVSVSSVSVSSVEIMFAKGIVTVVCNNANIVLEEG